MEIFLKSISAPSRLLLVGLSIRLMCSIVALVALWAGYFWATSSPGML
jgi:hypothetical protein